MNRIIISQFLFVFIFFSLALSASADSITLKSGRVFEGDIIEKTDGYIKIRTEDGVKKVPFKFIDPKKNKTIDSIDQITQEESLEAVSANPQPKTEIPLLDLGPQESVRVVASDARLTSLIRDLKSFNGDVQNDAARKIGEYENNTDALNALLDVLDDRDVNTTAINSIVDICRDTIVLDEASPEKFKNIILEHKDSYISWKALEPIERIGDERFIPVLMELIEQNQRRDSQYAGKALGAIADQGIVPDLIALLGSPKPVVTKEELGRFVNDVEAIWGLLQECGVIDDQGNIVNTMNLFWEFQATERYSPIATKKQAMEVSSLIHKKAATESKVYTQVGAAEALKVLGARSAIPALTEVLLGEDVSHSTLGNPPKEAAIDALLALEDKETLFPKLLKALDDEAEDVRERAARALQDFGQMDHSVLIPALIRKFDDQHFGVVNSAIASLINIGDRAALPALKELVSKKGNHHAIRALGEIGDKSAIAVLESAMAHTANAETIERCQKAINKLKNVPKKKEPDYPVHFPETKEGDMIKAAHQKIEQKHDMDGYAQALSHEDLYVRAAAIIGIKSFSEPLYSFKLPPRPTPEIMDRLAEMALKDEPLVSIEASSAYIQWPYLMKKETLMKVMQHAIMLLAHQNEHVRKRALDLVEEIALHSPHEFTQIESFGDQFIEALLDQLENITDEEVRSKLRSYIAAASFNCYSQKALDFMLKDFDEHPADYERYNPYGLIVKLDAREYIPFIKQKFKTSPASHQPGFMAVLTALKENIFEEDDLSSPYKCLVNFFRAIEDRKLKKARSMLDGSRLDASARDAIIEDHKDLFKRISRFEVNYNFMEEPFFSEGITCDLREGYAMKDEGQCLEDVYLMPIDFPDNVVRYFLKQKDDGTFMIHEIKERLRPAAQKKARPVINIAPEPIRNSGRRANRPSKITPQNIKFDAQNIKSILRTMSTSAETYMTCNNVYPSKVEDLLYDKTPYINRRYCDETIDGYRFQCDFLSSGYTIKAVPVEGNLGLATYLIKTGGYLVTE